jgi:hypothetical protein
MVGVGNPGKPWNGTEPRDEAPDSGPFFDKAPVFYSKVKKGGGVFLGYPDVGTALKRHFPERLTLRVYR